jgi:hypothetical protein
MCSPSKSTDTGSYLLSILDARVARENCENIKKGIRGYFD